MRCEDNKACGAGWGEPFMRLRCSREKQRRRERLRAGSESYNVGL